MKDFGYLGKSEHDVLTESEFTRINQLYASIKAILADEKTGKLPIALKYYQQAFRSDIDWSVRFLGLMMAMEALFGQGATEIAHQVSERTAFILKQSPDEREKLYKSMKSFYALRSKIAHGGSPVDGRKNMETPFEQLLRILRDSLIRIIEDSAILSLFWSSSRDQFDKAMRNLLFCGTMMIES